MRYTFSKMSKLGLVIFVIGFIFTIRGIRVRIYLSDVKHSYQAAEIKSGHYIAFDLTKEQLIGKYYTEPSGTVRYGPYCNANALTSVQTYIAAVNEESDYYVPLVVQKQYQKHFKEMLRNDTPYHVFGKFVKSKNNLDYEIIADCTGIKNHSAITQMISANYHIKIVDFKEEQQLLYQGILLLAAGLLILSVSVKKKVIK